MELTKEQIDRIIPDLAAPLTEDEYLASLKYNNDGLNYGSVMDYAPEEEKQFDDLLAQMVQM